MSVSVFEQMCAFLPAHCIRADVSLCDYATMRVGGPADIFVEPETEAQVLAVIEFAQAHSIPLLLLGNGSNLLISDEGYRGIVLHIGKQMSAITCEGSVITAQAGALLSAVARFAADRSLTGFEFAAGIPGSIGGGACMNAGAYGGEMKDVVLSARVLDRGKIRTIPVCELDFAYRHSAIMANNWLVLSVTLQLHPGNQEEILATMADLAARRRAKQPVQYPSCGSFFKRPTGYFAGALIEGANLKGYAIGGAQVSQLHAGFVINIGGATATDIYRLMKHVQKTVLDQSGVQLEPEVCLVGRFEA